jgi:FMN phosphatase YigB (HAD superfamily)
MTHPVRPIDWDAIDLVIFDVDGTLYDQKTLRLRMARLLLVNAAKSRSLKTLAILRAFRHCRERLAAEGGAFIDRQFEDTAARSGCSPDHVRAIVGEWIERRPLAHLRSCRLPGVDALFDGLRRSGKTVAIFSDYPASEKLDALALKADLIASAADDGILRLKPDPAGLLRLLEKSGMAAGRALDRDWAAADRADMPALIRARHRDERCPTFRSYLDPLFAPLFRREHHHAASDRRDLHASQL